uniref:Uncharacterized protein n=1 Tax=Aquisalinus luteolus TaxID=1566827 RepID=A0A8J3A655_9PROT|nr:hypothetical protein GCM10011355_29360 [Aquisalinus luteolus]
MIGMPAATGQDICDQMSARPAASTINPFRNARTHAMTEYPNSPHGLEAILRFFARGWGLNAVRSV